MRLPRKSNLERGVERGEFVRAFATSKSIHNMIRFEVFKVMVNLRGFFCSSITIALPVLSAVLGLGTNTVMWLY